MKAMTAYFIIRCLSKLSRYMIYTTPRYHYDIKIFYVMELYIFINSSVTRSIV